MKSKIIFPIVLLLILVSILATQSVFAQSNQITSTVNLSHLNVQLTYPSQVLPGQSANINVTAQAKDSFQLTTLTVQVYLTDQNNLQQLLSTTVAQNTMMSSGSQITKQIQVSVPSDAPRTSLVALVTESVSMTSYSYPYANSPYWNGYGMYSYGNSGNWYGYGNSNGNWYGYGLYPYYSNSYPSSSSQSSSDNAIAPLSYVQATTPEYVALQSQYQQLQAQNQQLRQQLQALQNSTAQKDSTISNLNNQLSSAQDTTTPVEIIAVILGIAVVALAVLHFKPTRTTDTESHPAAAKREDKTTDV